MRLSSKIGFSLLAGVLSCAAIGTAFADPGAVLAPGFYYGFGDGAAVALEVQPASHGIQKAVLSGTQNFKDSRARQIVVHGMRNVGVLTPDGAGKYSLRLEAEHHQPVCIYTLTYKAKYQGWGLSHPAKSGCVYYHGATWGYSGTLPSNVLKWYGKIN